MPGKPEGLSSTARKGTRVRHAEVVVPYEGRGEASSTTWGSRRIAERLRRRGRGTGENRRKDHQEGGRPPRVLRQRLAKRKARKEQLVKFSLCPMTSECSTAQKVRKSQQGSARAHADVTSTEQDRLAPHPAVRQGASRARNCAAISVFSFDGSTAVFFLGPAKKKMGGGKWPGFPGTPRLVDRATAGCGHPALRKHHWWYTAAGAALAVHSSGPRGSLGRHSLVMPSWVRMDSSWARMRAFWGPSSRWS